jgi:HNH endonuclease
MSAGTEIGEISPTAAIETHGDCTDTLMASAEDRLPHSEEHLNIPTQERQNLLAELSNALGNDKVPAVFWACVQVCDIGQLQKIVHQASADPACVSTIINSCEPLIRMWKQRPLGSSRQVSEASSPAQSPASANFGRSHLKGLEISSRPGSPASSNSRPSRPTKLALERDGKCCVFTKAGFIDAAHIYPHCLINSQAFGTAPARLTPGFWELLQNFWTRKQIQRWQEEIFPDPEDPSKTSDGCFNRICIQSNMHRWWTNGVFALRPLEYNDDRSELEVEWYWQPKQSHGRDDLVELGKMPLSSRDLDREGGGVLYAF